MAKKVAKTTSAPKAAPAEVATPTARNRNAVLVKKTASELHDLIGDTPIGVSFKELKLAVLAQHSAKVLADAGL